MKGKIFGRIYEYIRIYKNILCLSFAIRIEKGVLSGKGSDVWRGRMDVDVERRTGCVNF